VKRLILVLAILLLLPAFVSAHPGRTAADGCHYCRTNCDKWGVPWNKRHCHGGKEEVPPVIKDQNFKTISTDPPHELKGDQLGMSLSDFKKKHFRKAAKHETAPFCSDEYPKGHFIKPEFPESGEIKCMLQFPFEIRKEGVKTTIAGEEAYIIYKFLSKSVGVQEQAKLMYISVFFDRKFFEKVRDAYLSKYSDPSIRQKITRTGEVVKWENSSSSILLLENQAREKSFVIYEMNSLMEEYKARKEKIREDKVKAGVDDL